MTLRKLIMGYFLNDSTWQTIREKAHDETIKECPVPPELTSADELFLMKGNSDLAEMELLTMKGEFEIELDKVKRLFIINIVLTGISLIILIHK